MGAEYDLMWAQPFFFFCVAEARGVEEKDMSLKTFG